MKRALANLGQELNYQQLLRIDESLQGRPAKKQKEKQVVCMHWVKGQCKKGDFCDYLHVYDKERLPVCKYLKNEGRCKNGEQCLYRHEMQPTDFIAQEQKPQIVPPANAVQNEAEFCPYFERGYCHKGAQFCKFDHVSKFMNHNLVRSADSELSALYEFMGRLNDINRIQELCPRYLAGFCVFGPKCRLVHLKSVVLDNNLKVLANVDIDKILRRREEKLLRKKSESSSTTKSDTASSISTLKPSLNTICHNCG